MRPGSRCRRRNVLGRIARTNFVRRESVAKSRRQNPLLTPLLCVFFSAWAGFKPRTISLLAFQGMGRAGPQTRGHERRSRDKFGLFTISEVMDKGFADPMMLGYVDIVQVARANAELLLLRALANPQTGI